MINTETMTNTQDTIQEVRSPGGLQIRELEVSYGKNKVIRGIDLEFHPGKITAIIGPSGCGKTTMLRTLNRMSELTPGCKVKGQILLDGEDVLRMDPILLRRRVGMVFQRPNPFPKSIKENLLYGIKAQKKKVDNNATIKSCLEKAALWDELHNRLNDNAWALSLGQQQRLCIARTMAISPEVILLDEPASSLDPISTGALEESIMAMRGEYTLVIITHNMNEAKKISDYTAFLYNGQLHEYGETEQIFNNPKQPVTKQYIAGKLY